jgi:Ni,Fe-hydrogenase maturation factor
MIPQLHIIGLGSWDHGDDAAGLIVAARLRDRNLPGIRVSLDTAQGGRLLELLQPREPTVILQATPVCQLAACGDIRVLKYPEDAGQLPAWPEGFDRGMCLSELLELAADLGRQPRDCWIHLLGVNSVVRYMPESQELLAAIPGFVTRVETEIMRLAQPASQAGTKHAWPTIGSRIAPDRIQLADFR